MASHPATQPGDEVNPTIDRASGSPRSSAPDAVWGWRNSTHARCRGSWSGRCARSCRSARTGRGTGRAAPRRAAGSIRYPSGALTLKAWLAEPPADGKRHPAIVYVHGGYSFARDDWEAAAPYAKAGYAVLTPMLRGENGNPGDYEAYYGEVDDAIAAGRYLASLPGVDPDKVFIAGHSIGGVIVRPGW